MSATAGHGVQKRAAVLAERESLWLVMLAFGWRDINILR